MRNLRPESRWRREILDASFTSECVRQRSLHGQNGLLNVAHPALHTVRPNDGREFERPFRSTRIRILIAHCDPLVSAGIEATLRMYVEFETTVCNVVSESWQAPALALPPVDVVVADYDTALRLVTSTIPGAPRVMILTHSDSEARIRHALERGARGYLFLGCSLQDLLYGLRLVAAGSIALAPVAANRITHWMKQQPLTKRERDVLRCMTLGFHNKGIAGELGVALGTVKTYVQSVLAKLHATSRTEAVAIALRRGLLREECE